jgi:hypothetical protein
MSWSLGPARSFRPHSREFESRRTPDVLPPAEVLAEIGLMLAAHLAVALVVALTLRALAIA